MSSFTYFMLGAPKSYVSRGQVSYMRGRCQTGKHRSFTCPFFKGKTTRASIPHRNFHVKIPNFYVFAVNLFLKISRPAVVHLQWWLYQQWTVLDRILLEEWNEGAGELYLQPGFWRDCGGSTWFSLSLLINFIRWAIFLFMYLYYSTKIHIFKPNKWW